MGTMARAGSWWKGILAAGAVMALSAGMAMAQAEFMAGQPFAAPGEAATLSVYTGAAPQEFALPQIGATLSMRLFPLSADRELRMGLDKAGAGEQSYAGNNAKMHVKMVSKDTMIAEFETGKDLRGLARIEMRMADGGTTVSLMRDQPGVRFEKGDAKIHVQVFGTRPFRNPGKTGATIVASLEPEKKVRVVISTTPQGEKESMEAKLAFLQAARREEMAYVAE